MNPYEEFLHHQSLDLLAEQVERLSANDEYAAIRRLTPYQLSCVRSVLYTRALQEIVFGSPESSILDFVRQTQRKIRELLWTN